MSLHSGLSRRSALRRLGGVGAAALAAAGVGRRSAAAREATPATAGHPLVGTWRVTVDDPAQSPILSTYTADGTYADGNVPVSPAPPGAPHRLEFFGSGHGAWVATGERTAAVALEILRADEHGTRLPAFSTRGTVELDDTLDAYRGTWTVDLVEASGTVVETFHVTSRATRMRVEAMEPGTAATGTPTP